jgi:hypothetical protein
MLEVFQEFKFCHCKDMIHSVEPVGSARHLYVVCIDGAICLQIQKKFAPDPAIFSSKNKILILLYCILYTELCKIYQYVMAKRQDMMF